MKRILLIITILAFTISTANAKLILIRIETVLQEAKEIKTIIVLGYSNSMMLYKLENSKDTLRINCTTKKYSEPFRQSLIKSKMMKEIDLAGSWPVAGQKVLIVINAKRGVSLFAFKINGDYRFWDPNSLPFANSMFSIPKNSLFKPLTDCDDPFPGKDVNSWICTDGCLASASAIKERG